MHSSRRDTFRPINSSPIAKIYPDGKIIKQNITKRSSSNINLKTDTSKKKEKNNPIIKASVNNYVALVKFYPGQDPKILDYYKRSGYQGLVIEMSGLGHVISEGKHNWLPTIKRLVSDGMIICAAPQTLYGRLDPYIYSPGRKLESLGVIYLEDMLPETALIKLGWILSQTKDKKKIKDLMTTDLRGEFNDRLGNEFLN